ncbi:MAG: FAD-dependent oxidoreductase [Fusobacteria bacterium]|nr:FAD-dependent oxidoreductase [Fusobacteriota bacterium]
MDLMLNFGIIGIEKESKIIKFNETILYDVIIIGGGAAGLTASVYCMRKGLKTGIIGKNIGGQITSTKNIENYMGYKNVEGIDLVEKFKEQVKQFEISYIDDKEVISLKNEGNINYIELDDGKVYRSKTVIIATGAKWRKLGVKGENELIGKGVAFCTTCDAPLYKDKKVAIIGGGNSGLEAALDLIKIVEKLYLIEYDNKIKADEILVKKLGEYSNYEILTGHQVIEIIGKDKVEKIVLENRNNKEVDRLIVDGVFIEIGLEPNSEFLGNLLELDSNNRIKVDCSCKTSIESIFAAGDVTTVPYNQIIIAASEGAKAALSAYNYLTKSE